MSIKRCLGALALGGLLVSPSLAKADNAWAEPTASSSGYTYSAAGIPGQAVQTGNTDLSSLLSSLSPSDNNVNAADPTTSAPASDNSNGASVIPQYFDDSGEKPNIHGFAEAPLLTAYITPRGLVVLKNGVVFQPVIGLVLPIGDVGPFKDLTLISGLWNCVGTAQNDPLEGDWDEMDYFAEVSTNVTKEINLGLTYGLWSFPESTAVAKPRNEENLDLLVSYDDSGFFGDSSFGFHPYADFWWAISGSSTVALGRPGGTGYIQLGMTPTYTLKMIAGYPITFKMPVYVSVGPRDFWSWGPNTVFGGGNVGVFSAGLDASMPLAFIPGRYGNWHADCGLTYMNLINSTLLQAGNTGTGAGNTDRNVFIGEVGIGVSF